MNLSAPYIQRPVMTCLVMFSIILVGLLAYRQLPVSNLPNVDYPTITVNVDFPGASPETMANTVATPLEKEFMTIPGVTSVSSTNNLGLSRIVLQFEISKSMDSAAQDVQSAISRARTKLPPDLPNEPTYKKVNPSDTPIMYIALTSETMHPAELYTYANTFIGQRLSMIEGVAQVITYGSPFAVRVEIDPNKLANVGVTLNEVADTIRLANPYLPTGDIDGPIGSKTIIAETKQMERAEGYNPLIIAYRDNAPIRIQDVGFAMNDLQRNKYSLYYYEGGKKIPTVVLAIQRQPGANTVKVSRAIQEFLPTFAGELPGSVSLKIAYDKAQYITESVEEVEFTLLIAFLLVILVIFLYIGSLRDTIIPSLILPISIIGTFIFMYLFGYTIDTLSLLALILAIGFIIDDAIVVIENIVRRVEGGESPWIAALKGSKQIGFTVVSMTLSLVAVFIPLIFMPGLIGKIFQEFAITLMVITLLSGIVSLTLTPMLCSRLLKSREKEKPTYFENLAKKMNSGMIAIYKPLLNWFLDNRWAALLLGGVSIILSGYYFISLPKDFIPDDDIGFIIAYTQTQEGSSSTNTKEHQEEVNAVLQADPNIEGFVSIAAYPQFRNGIIFIRLKPRRERISIQEVSQELYKKLTQVAGINTFLKTVPLIDLSTGTESKGSYQYTLQAMDPAILNSSAKELITKMQALPGFQGVTSDLEVSTPQLKIDVLRDRASTLGVNAQKIQEALELGYSGGRVSRIQTPIDQYDIIVELDLPFTRNVSSLSDIYVRSDISKQLVPLNAVASWREVVGAATISHLSQVPSVSIWFNILPDIPLGVALQNLTDLAKETLPGNVIGQIKGTGETFLESIQNIGFLLVLSVLAIYIVLGILYESFIHPLTILSTLPPATLGGLATLAFLGLPLSLYGYLGIILLIGIVKKNGIIMVDFALENERVHHQTPREAIYNACITRFRPIMMTTVTAIMGAIPIALAIGASAEARRPLGYVIIGGLLFSQLITLLVTPVIYLYMDKVNQRFALNVPQEQQG